MIDKIVSHYRILEKLGEGGMGVVYKAEDINLHRPVALKFLGPRALDSAEGEARFRHEAQAAAALDHPNICSIYEIGETDGQTFIAMAFVDGRDLSEQIASGPVPLEKALDLAGQIAAGLSEAHAKGVVHRDVKPANIMLTADGRVKIMDFGLAKSSMHTRLTQTGSTTGTVSYMSPEQSRSEEVDHRTDIWSLGVVLYEMVIGRRPFGGEHEQAVIYSILNEEPELITSQRTGVPLELERIVGKAMAKRPDERYQHADELLVDLKTLARQLESSGTATSTVVQPRQPKKAKSIPLKTAGFIAAAVMIAAAAVWLLSTRFGGSKPVLDPGRVVVAAFENRTGDDALDPIGPMAADWITQGLSRVDEVEVVSAMGILQSPQTTQVGGDVPGEVDPLRALAQSTGAGIVVSGSYYLEGDSLQFQAQMTDAARGRVIVALPAVAGPRSAPMKSIEALRQKIMGALAARFGGFGMTGETEQAPDYDAYCEHVVGMGLFGSDYAEALRHFERAAELDTTFISPRIMMVFCYSNRGRYAEAESLVVLLNAARSRLTEDERLYVRFLEALLRRDYAECLRFLRPLAKRSPNNGGINYLAGLLATRVNRPQETVDTYERYQSSRRHSPATVAWWRLSNWSEAHHMLGNHQEELKIVQRALEQFPDVPWLWANEVQAMAALGRVDEVNRIIDECMALFEQLEDRCLVVLCAAQELRAHGHAQAALALAPRAGDLMVSLRSEPSPTETARYYAAIMLCAVERWDEALTLFRELASEDPEQEDYKGCLGILAARRGDRETAFAIFDELRGLERPYMFGDNLYWCACIKAHLGDLEQAVELLRDAFSRGTRFTVGLHSDWELIPLWDYPPFQELIRPKG